MPTDGERFETKEIRAGERRDERGPLATPTYAAPTDEYETPSSNEP